MKKIFMLFIGILCFIGVCGFVGVNAATPNVNVIEATKVTFQNVATGQYLNFDYGILKNGTSVRVWPWDGTTEQLWSIDNVEGSVYRINTYKSSQYCLDVYRGNSKLKANQKCDIWKTATDSYAQNVTFYQCDDGTFIIRMAEAPNLALSVSKSKDRVALASFNASSKAQKWIVKNSKGNKIDIVKKINPADSFQGIASVDYVKTGGTYTVGGIKYYEAKTTREYNKVPKGTGFFVDQDGIVVNNADIYNKILATKLFNDTINYFKNSTNIYIDCAMTYYDVCTKVVVNEKLGTLIGKGTGIAFNIYAGNPLSLADACIEVTSEVASPDTFKTTLWLNMLRAYCNNVVAYGRLAQKALEKDLSDYDNMSTALNYFAECKANFAAIEHLGGDTLKEMANTSVFKELCKYIKNVIAGFADTQIPGDAATQIAMYVYNGAISIMDFAMSSGSDKAYYDDLNATKKTYNRDFYAKDSTSNNLCQPETLDFVAPLVSSYKTNIRTQNWGNKYSTSRYHLGVDLGTSGNKYTNVCSIADGVVYNILSANKSDGWGNLVIVKHTMPNGKVFYSGYGHLQSVNVKINDTVSAGTKLGVMGTTGNSTGPHLHLLVFTGSFSKTRIPAGYSSNKISGDSYKVKGITYYNPIKVISTKGGIIK